MKKIFILFSFISIFSFVQNISAESMYSPTWGFFIDLPEGYELVEGDGKDRFSFAGPEKLKFDIIVYSRYNTLLDMLEDINRRLSNQGDVDLFDYNGKQAAIMKLNFGNNDGWGFAVELDNTTGKQPPMLIALAYGPADKTDFELFHISALDSISPTTAERYYPGPLLEYGFPRGAPVNSALVNGMNVMFYENDAEASQVLIEREFSILQSYMNSPLLREATARYYRFIYRDSYDRVKNAVDAIAQSFGGRPNLNDTEKREFAQKILSFVQSFEYERDLSGSDFLNLINAVTEGRGDCDNRAMLFAIILANTNIRSAMMLSHHYSHAMALADIKGSGARFESDGIQWLVAETTALIDIGLIAQDVSNPQHWFAIMLE